MNQQQQPQHAWSAFHDGKLSNEREQDARDYSAKCQHNFQTWAGNPMINMCHCGDWHWKKG